MLQIAKNLALSHASPNFKTRIEEFNNSYIFSRNILVAFTVVLISIGVLLFQHLIPFNWLFYVFLIFLAVWWRARDRAIYYTREILVAAYYADIKEA